MPCLCQRYGGRNFVTDKDLVPRYDRLSSAILFLVFHSINNFNVFQIRYNVSILVFFLLPIAFHCTMVTGMEAHASDDGKKVQVLLNVGGPDRVSRLQMAESVAVVRGYNPSIIKSVSASSVLSCLWNVAFKHPYICLFSVST